LLKEKVKFELSQIEKEIRIIQLLKDKIEHGALDEIEIRAAASSLHSIYNGIEKILMILIGKLEIKEESNWHTKLLELGESKGIITKNLRNKLREYMGFRHFYRHTYSFMLDNGLIKPLINNIEVTYNGFKEEILKLV